MSDNNATNATTACYGYCQYRLPCGYCKEMQSICPYAGAGTIKITCGTTCLDNDGKTMQVNYRDNSAVHIINNADNVTL